MFPDLLFTTWHALVLVFILCIVGTGVLNTFVFQHPQDLVDSSAVTPLPKVSVLVPARNEERNIHACLSSLLAQDAPPHEIFLLDDRSTDATRQIALQLGFEETATARLRILSGGPLQEGWTGKANACRQLAEAATGDYLLFTDADTIHAPGSVRTAVRYAVAGRTDLLSAWPRQITGTFVEKLVIPLVGLLIFGFLPQWMAALAQRFPCVARCIPPSKLRMLGAANGQFLLFKRTSYDALGGHASVRDHLVEDVALGRAVVERAGEGMRLVNCDGSRLVQCRMYQSGAEVWEGFTKNLRPAFESSSLMFFMSLVIQFVTFVLPFVLLPFGGKYLPWLGAQVAIILVFRGALSIRFQTSWWSVALHPFAHSFALLIALNSWWQWSRGGVTWKGRSYRKNS